MHLSRDHDGETQAPTVLHDHCSSKDNKAHTEPTSLNCKHRNSHASGRRQAKPLSGMEKSHPFHRIPVAIGQRRARHPGRKTCLMPCEEKRIKSSGEAKFTEMHSRHAIRTLRPFLQGYPVPFSLPPTQAHSSRKGTRDLLTATSQEHHLAIMQKPRASRNMVPPRYQ